MGQRLWMWSIHADGREGQWQPWLLLDALPCPAGGVFADANTMCVHGCASTDRVLCERMCPLVATVPKYHEPHPEVVQVRTSDTRSINQHHHRQPVHPLTTWRAVPGLCCSWKSASGTTTRSTR